MTPDRKRIYFFSSHTGSASPAESSNAAKLEIQDPVLEALRKCIAEHGAKGHRNAAKCGEIMSTNQWFKDNAGETTMAALKKKLIVTVKLGGGVIPPCTKDGGTKITGEKGVERGSHGCSEYLAQLGFTPAQIIGYVPPANSCSGSPAKRWWLGKRGPKNPKGSKIEACPLQKITKGKTSQQKTIKGNSKKPAPKAGAVKPKGKTGGK